MLKRSLFNDEHEMFRDSVRKFIEREIVPFHAEWEKAGIVPRALWLEAGEAGLLCTNISEEFGGLGAGFLYNPLDRSRAEAATDRAQFRCC
jgi:alkylation response protein AidB-like acyl-CoA dehydrogenase